jgi:HD-like signal output (HDOD) protein/signal transduction histidine kinase
MVATPGAILDFARVPHNGRPTPVRQVELILERIDALPTLPAVAARIIRISTASDVEMDEIAAIIESDPALASRILALCRKSDKGLGDRISSVKRAVVMLGIEAVRSAVLSVCVCDLVARDAGKQKLDTQLASDGDDVAPQVFDRLGLWKHSIAVAAAAEMLAERSPHLRHVRDEAFLAGLLHSVGRIAISFALPRAYVRVLAVAAKRNARSASVERELLGLDHHTAGKRLASHWNLPASLQEAIWLHDQPAQATTAAASKDLITVVTAARALCRHLHLGWSGDFDTVIDVKAVWQRLAITADPAGFMPQLQELVSQRLQLLGIDQLTTPQVFIESLANVTQHLSAINAQLHDQARHAHAMQRILAAIDSFHASTRALSSIHDAAQAVLTSARSTLGPGYACLLLREQTGNDWRLLTTTAPDKPLYDHAIVVSATDESDAMGEMLASDAQGPGALGALSDLLHELADHLAGAPDVRKLRVLPLWVASAGSRVYASAGALICERDVPPQLRSLLQPLFAAWSNALRAAIEQTRAARMHEKLVESARQLSEAQALIAHQEAYAKLGEVTAGAAHEMNNPLAIIAGRAQMLAQKLRDDRDKAAAMAITSAAKELGDLIQSLHLLSVTPQPQVSDCVMHEAVKRVVAQSLVRACADTKVEVDLSRAPNTVRLDTELLVAALTEVVTNAIESNPEGSVRIVALREGERIAFEVMDNGPGFSEKALSHAMDPFFSEKPAGRKRGLGLTRARTLAHTLAGDITLANIRERPDGPIKGAIVTLTARTHR